MCFQKRKFEETYRSIKLQWFRFTASIYVSAYEEQKQRLISALKTPHTWDITAIVPFNKLQSCIFVGALFFKKKTKNKKQTTIKNKL